MSVNIFLNFAGNAKEALEFYTKLFRLDEPEVVTFRDAEEHGYTFKEEDKDKIFYSSIKLGNITIMIGDVVGRDVTIGDNVSITYNLKTVDEVRRLYDLTRDEGEIVFEMGKTFYSEMYSAVTDKFGVTWHFLL